MTKTNIIVVLFFGVVLSGCGKVYDPVLDEIYDPEKIDPPPQKQAVEADPLRQVFWGDLHIHTSYSPDAYIMGVRTLPDDAYIFAKGGTIQHGVGYPIRMSRPLDFAAVTDHSEYLGLPRYLDGGLAPDQVGDYGYDPNLRAALEGGKLGYLKHFLTEWIMKISSKEARDSSFGGNGHADIKKTAWDKVVESAQAHYEPGVFTTFIAYEWTSMPGGKNLHRNVIYRGDDFPEMPYSALESDNPEDLWAALDEQNNNGMSVLSISHNGNVSGGEMYDSVMYDGGKLNKDYADLRMRIEPLAEIFQVKGQSETHPLLSDEDQFANFEVLDTLMSSDGAFSEPKGSYIRDALRTGLEFSHSESFNPYRFGVIGASDSHNASSPVDENNYHGKLPLMDGTAGIRLGQYSKMAYEKSPARRWSAMGLAGVWAEGNTREAIYDALKRKETYATSGPRMSVRFFAGRDYPQDLLGKSDLLEIAYRDGVPMGGDLVVEEQAPRFIVWASKDPESGNLDRIQIIKGWVDADGKSHEKIFNVAASGGRLEQAVDGEIAAVGNSVDINSASYTNAIGSPQLAAVWVDPEFEPAQEAFYYARVLEIPTPRWSTYDAATLGVDAPAPATIQERAVTSAIWLSPARAM